jgi:hypothetical protein
LNRFALQRKPAIFMTLQDVKHAKFMTKLFEPDADFGRYLASVAERDVDLLLRRNFISLTRSSRGFATRSD